MTTHVTPDMTCPMCGYVSDRASSVTADNEPPEPGDVTVCCGCGAILLFDACSECGELGMRLPEIEEALYLEENHQDTMVQVAQVQAMILARIEAERPKGPLN